jgi:hypothetical protein
LNGGASHVAAFGERRRRNRYDRTGDPAIDIGDVGTRIGVDPRHDRAIHRGVGDVDVVEVAAANRIRRAIDFARTQWEPGDAR